MTCTEFLAQLDEFLDGSAAAQLKPVLEEHLKGCSSCTVTVSTTRKTIEIYRSHELYELPDSLRDRLRTAIMERCKKC